MVLSKGRENNQKFLKRYMINHNLRYGYKREDHNKPQSTKLFMAYPVCSNYLNYFKKIKEDLFEILPLYIKNILFILSCKL